MLVATMAPEQDWLHATPEALRGKRVHRIVLATNYGIDESGVRRAIERGVQAFLTNARGAKALRAPLTEALQRDRGRYAVFSFASPGIAGWIVRRAVESHLRALKTDYLDVLLLPWLGRFSAWTKGTRSALESLKAEGKVRSIGMSIHDRPRAGRLAAEGVVDVLMLRYNAAHPGAEREVFPHRQNGRPSVMAYTATSWRKLLRPPKNWDGPTMTAGDCYRFQLSSPDVDLALMAPANTAQLDANFDALEKGPLSSDEQTWMRAYGKAVHG